MNQSEIYWTHINDIVLSAHLSFLTFLWEFGFIVLVMSAIYEDDEDVKHICCSVNEKTSSSSFLPLCQSQRKGKLFSYGTKNFASTQKATDFFAQMLCLLHSFRT